MYQHFLLSARPSDDATIFHRNKRDADEELSTDSSDDATTISPSNERDADEELSASSSDDATTISPSNEREADEEPSAHLSDSMTNISARNERGTHEESTESDIAEDSADEDTTLRKRERRSVTDEIPVTIECFVEII